MNKSWNGNWNVNVEIQMVWEIIPCHLVISYRCFRGACCLHLQGPGISSSWILWPWRWRQQAVL